VRRRRRRRRQEEYYYNIGRREVGRRWSELDLHMEKIIT
jgi:hypothetical protein